MGWFPTIPQSRRVGFSVKTNAQYTAQRQVGIDIAHAIAQWFPLKMRHGKSKPKPAEEPRVRYVSTNISLEEELKSEALKLVADKGYRISEYIAEMFKVQLIAAGRWQPKEPRIEPMPELLKKKTQ